MSVWGRNQQVCSTCRYWSGRRDINFTCDFFEALEPQGKCCNLHSGFNNCRMDEGSWCNNWEPFRKD